MEFKFDNRSQDTVNKKKIKKKQAFRISLSWNIKVNVCVAVFNSEIKLKSYTGLMAERRKP